MSTIARRVQALEVYREQRERRKPVGIVEEYRAWLQTLDGQHDLDMRPGEDLNAVVRRRLQIVDGWNLSGLPGDSLATKEHAVDLACQGRLTVAPEVRHAARHWFEKYEAT